MQLVRSVREMQSLASGFRRASVRLAFVPTMGYLHEGHLSLLRTARAHGDKVVLSIFVNPTQFGPSEDLGRYPRDLDGDLAKAESAAADVAFVPEASDVYPAGFQTYVEVRELERGLCGDKRPGHFVGVATVVLKLFNIVLPNAALFGEKDFQQLQVIRQMVKDLNLPVEIVGCPIVREPDGLALSSRNSYLSSAERRDALALSRALGRAAQAFAAGTRDAAILVGEAQAILQATPTVRVDYLTLADAASLAPLSGPVERPAVLLVAAFVGRTRLIDNVLLAP